MGKASVESVVSLRVPLQYNEDTLLPCPSKRDHSKDLIRLDGPLMPVTLSVPKGKTNRCLGIHSSEYGELFVKFSLYRLHGLVRRPPVVFVPIRVDTTLASQSVHGAQSSPLLWMKPVELSNIGWIHRLW